MSIEIGKKIQYIIKNAKRDKYVMADGREVVCNEYEHTHGNMVKFFPKGARVRLGVFLCNWHGHRGYEKTIAPIDYAISNQDRWQSIEYEGEISEIIRKDGNSATYSAEQATEYCYTADNKVRLIDGMADLSNWYVITLSYQASDVWRRCGRRTYLNLMSGEELSKEVKAGTGRRIDQEIRVFGGRKNALNYMFNNENK